jgi:hypothetical protein
MEISCIRITALLAEKTLRNTGVERRRNGRRMERTRKMIMSLTVEDIRIDFHD